MHHWRPCLKLHSAILIVLSTMVAKDANHRFPIIVVEEKDRIGGNREAFSSLKTLVFSFGSGRWPFPKDSGHLSRRPSVNPAWSISPGLIFLEDSESVCFDFFLLLLHGLFCSFAFCFRVHVSTSIFFLLRVFFSTAHAYMYTTR